MVVTASRMPVPAVIDATENHSDREKSFQAHSEAVGRGQSECAAENSGGKHAAVDCRRGTNFDHTMRARIKPPKCGCVSVPRLGRMRVDQTHLQPSPALQTPHVRAATKQCRA
eukprot:5921348-Pleurochrysis_carterae.AAC.1